jgi:hypothetical protein
VFVLPAGVPVPLAALIRIAGMTAALLLAGDAHQEGRVLVRQVAGWFPARPGEGGDRAWRNQVEAVEERGEFRWSKYLQRGGLVFSGELAGERLLSRTITRAFLPGSLTIWVTAPGTRGARRGSPRKYFLPSASNQQRPLFVSST